VHELDVTDNGIGIPEGELRVLKSLGLLVMQERALLFGGDVSCRVAGSQRESSTPCRRHHPLPRAGNA